MKYCLKFGTLIEQKMLYQIASNLSQSDIAVKGKLKVKLRPVNGLEIDLEGKVRL